MSYARRVAADRSFKLDSIDPDADAGLDKRQGEKLTAALTAELDELVDLLDYAGQHALLLVFQGRDTAGKDGVIRHLLSHIRAVTARVESFKVPTEEERAHDFLWRVHRKTPGRGESVLFNRSHYEDVLVVRVHSLQPESEWRPHFDAINAFEDLLVRADTIVVKFFLHISREEQEERLLAREQDTDKAWKLSVGDWKEREHWDAYSEAYEEAMSRCSRPHAPWFVVPSNRKWFRDLAVTEQVVKALRVHKNDWLKSLEDLGREAKAELAKFRGEKLPG